MIEIFIIIVVLLLLALMAYFVYRRWIKTRPDRAIALRNNSLVNRNYFFQKPSGQTSSDPYRYNNASNQIYTSTTVPFHEDFDEDSYDRRRILDEEARKKHQDVHNSWAVTEKSGGGSFSSSTETHNLLSTAQEDDQSTPAFAEFSGNPSNEPAENLSTINTDRKTTGSSTFA